MFEVQVDYVMSLASLASLIPRLVHAAQHGSRSCRRRRLWRRRPSSSSFHGRPCREPHTNPGPNAAPSSGKGCWNAPCRAGWRPGTGWNTPAPGSPGNIPRLTGATHSSASTNGANIGDTILENKIHPRAVGTAPPCESHSATREPRWRPRCTRTFRPNNANTSRKHRTQSGGLP